MNKVLYIYVFVLALIPANLNSIPLFSVKPIQLYVGDLLNAVLGYATIRYLAGFSWKEADIEERAYLLFVAWLLVEVAIGYTKYGYRSFGELRTAANFLCYFLPVTVLSNKNPVQQMRSTITIVPRLLMVAAWSSLVMYFLAPSLGFAVEDYRGERVINSAQTYFLLSGAAYIAIHYIVTRRTDNWSKLVGIAFLLVALLSKNRTSIIAVGSTALLFLVFSRKRGSIVKWGVLVAIAILGMLSVSSSLREDVATTFEGVLNPGDDPDLQWRLVYQAAALDQVWEAPILGKGYGSYFEIYVPGLRFDQPDQNMPHNQYLVLLMKAGVVGVILWLSAFALLLRKVRRLWSRLRVNAEVRSVALMLLLILLSQLLYGLAYEFFFFYGIFHGFTLLLLRSVNEIPDQPKRSSVSPGVIG